jgi:segregation and condensation protein B
VTRKKSRKNGKAAKVDTTIDDTKVDPAIDATLDDAKVDTTIDAATTTDDARVDDAAASAPPESDRPTLVDMGATDAFAPDDALLEGRAVDVAGLEAIDPADIASVATEATTGEIPDAGSESNPRHGDFQSPALLDDDAPSTESAPATEAEIEIEQARGLSDSHLRGLLEALVFASDKPMKSNELARLASAPVRQVKDALAKLKAEFTPRGIVLDEVAGGWLFRTNAQFAPFVRELAGGKPVRLSRAQIETLAIAAYRQPITRPEIDEIRGVDSGATLKLLLERDLIRILGKKDEPGRPLLYGTTTHFLEFFNMKSLKDLPTLREFTELSDESRRVAETELGDVLPPSSPATPAPTHEHETARRDDETAQVAHNETEDDDGSLREHEALDDDATHDPGAPDHDPAPHDPGADDPVAHDDATVDADTTPDDERDTLGPPAPIED